jgi:hypothetical protein
MTPVSRPRCGPGLAGSLLLALATAATAAEPAARALAHTVTIVHPGDAAARTLPHTLVQTFDADGEPCAYSMWVDSVICREKVCDVVKVRLHWDALGGYQRFEVAPGSQLTKLDHVPFTKADLAHLQDILSDPESPLKEVDKEAMTAKPGKSPAGVDAVSGPTILTLKSAVVIGAGYTCYDLWHWSNGLLADHIRSLTGTGSSKEKLHAFLSSGDTSAALLAIKHLGERGINDRATLDAILASATKGHEDLVNPTLAYLGKAAPGEEVRDDAILRLFAGTGSKQRVLILDALTDSPAKRTPAFHDRLCDHLPSLETYYEVHLFLTLMEAKNPSSPKVLQKTAKLLDHEKFFVSRRAYQHLAKHTLPEDIQRRVDAYAEEHQDRL